jgi:hypothetical protein
VFSVLYVYLTSIRITTVRINIKSSISWYAWTSQRCLHSWLRQTEVLTKCQFWRHTITKTVFSGHFRSIFLMSTSALPNRKLWNVTLLSGYGIKAFCFLPESLLTFCGNFSFIIFIFGWSSDGIQWPKFRP